MFAARQPAGLAAGPCQGFEAVVGAMSSIRWDLVSLLDAHITFPLAREHVAAVAAHRHEQALQAVDQPAPNSYHWRATVRTGCGDLP